MSIKRMTAVWEHSEHKGTSLVLLLALADFADDYGHGWPGTTTLYRKARISTPTGTKHIEKLEASGELIVLRRPGKVSQYIVVTAFSDEERQDAVTRVNAKMGDVLIDPDQLEEYMIGRTEELTSKPVLPGTSKPVFTGTGKPVLKRSVIEPSLEPSISSPDGDPAQKPTPKPKPTTEEWTALGEAIQNVLKVHGRKLNHVRHMMLGTSKTGLWQEHNFGCPATADEVRQFGKWYSVNYPGAVPPSGAESLQCHFYAFRAAPNGSDPKTDPLVITPDGPKPSSQLKLAPVKPKPAIPF